MTLRSISALLFAASLAIFAAGCVATEEEASSEPYAASCGDVIDLTEPEVLAALADSRLVALGEPEKLASGASTLRFTTVLEGAGRVAPTTTTWSATCSPRDCGEHCRQDGCTVRMGTNIPRQCTPSACVSITGVPCRESLCTLVIVPVSPEPGPVNEVPGLP